MQKPAFVREQIQALPNVKVKRAQAQDQLTQQIGVSNKFFSTFDSLQKKGGEITTDIVFPLLQSFDSIEHIIYRELLQQQFSQEEQLSLFMLLNQVQINHKAVVIKQIELDLPPWITNASPNEDRNEVAQIWRSITQRGGDGVFRIENMTTGIVGKLVPSPARRDLQDDLFASLARLITRPVGRNLLHILHTQGLTGKAIKFALNPTSYQLGGTSPMAGPDGVGANCQWNGNVLVRNVGSGGQMTYVVGLTDADMMDFDHANRLLPSPVFIGLGHELIHIAHYQHGTYMGAATHHYPEVAPIYQRLFPKTALPNIPAAYQGGGSLEEFLTIPEHAEQMQVTAELQLANPQNMQYELQNFTPKNLQEILRLNIEATIPTENDIRREHDLGERHAHRSIANPILYPKATEDDPGASITRPKQWAESVGIIAKS